MDQETPFAINRASVVSDIIDGEAVIINLSTGTYYSLNETGSAVWDAFRAGPTSVHGLAAQFRARYDGNPDAIREALEATFARLTAEGLIVATPGAVVGPPPAHGGDIAAPGAVAAPTPADGGDVAARMAFVTPVLEVHTDMQDFLLVDPIHEVDDSGKPSPHGK